MKKSSLAPLFAIAFALLLTAGAARADLLVLKVSGVLSANSLLNSVALGVDTPFSFELQFDPSADFIEESGPGWATYDARNLLFTLGGNSYSTTQTIYALIGDPRSETSSYMAGFIIDPWDYFFGGFTTTTPEITDLTPAPTVFSGPTGNSYVQTGFALNLTGLGVLETDYDNVGFTSATLEAVPEPSAWAMLGMGGPALLLGALWLRGRKA